jgi:hypothetical protein
VHGAGLWGLTAVAGTLLVSMAIASAIGAGVQAGGAVLSLGGRALPSVAMNLDADDVLAPVNQKLRQQGMAPVTSPQLQAATKDVIDRAIREGRIDRATVAGAIAANTGLDRPEAALLAARIESQFNQSVGQLRHGALQAAEATGKALWAVFFALLLGLISSVAGAIVGVSRRQRESIEAPVIPTPTPVRPVERHVPVETSP